MGREGEGGRVREVVAAQVGEREEWMEEEVRARYLWPTRSSVLWYCVYNG